MGTKKEDAIDLSVLPWPNNDADIDDASVVSSQKLTLDGGPLSNQSRKFYNKCLDAFQNLDSAESDPNEDTVPDRQTGQDKWH